MVYYPYHGILISLDITNVVAMGVHLPAQAEVTLELPAMTINGQHYEPQTLHFERRVFEEVSTVNC